MATTATSTLATLLTSVGSIVTSAIGWMGSYVTAITSTGNEILLLFIILPLVGLGISMIKRMISL